MPDLHQVVSASHANADVMKTLVPSGPPEPESNDFSFMIQPNFQTTERHQLLFGPNT